MKNNKTLTIALGILLVVAIIYIAVVQVQAYNFKKLQEQQGVYQQGMQDGYEVAVMQLMEQLATCNQVPLFAQNVTLNAVAVECLQQAQAPVEE